jgi:glycine/D-amino acid oxidase-like deaminating enzyme
MPQIKVEALVIGAGFAGLLTVRELVKKGYNTLLITEGDVGEGQSLHNHGKYNFIVIIINRLVASRIYFPK